MDDLQRQGVQLLVLPFVNKMSPKRHTICGDNSCMGQAYKMIKQDLLKEVRELFGTTTRIYSMPRACTKYLLHVHRCRVFSNSSFFPLLLSVYPGHTDGINRVNPAAENPVGIIAGSAVAVVVCMIIVIIMVVIFLRR